LPDLHKSVPPLKSC